MFERMISIIKEGNNKCLTTDCFLKKELEKNLTLLLLTATKWDNDDYFVKFDGEVYECYVKFNLTEGLFIIDRVTGKCLGKVVASNYNGSKGVKEYIKEVTDVLYKVTRLGLYDAIDVEYLFSDVTMTAYDKNFSY